jgi:hypothetical protein
VTPRAVPAGSRRAAQRSNGDDGKDGLTGSNDPAAVIRH